MTVQRFPTLDPDDLRGTRDAMHAYAQILGDLLKALRPRRKHWWHASLRPSLSGLTTGVVRTGVDFEIELDLVADELRVRSVDGNVTRPLGGEPPAIVASWLEDTLAGIGVELALGSGDRERSDESFTDYSAAQGARMQGALASVAAALEDFRAGIREETSPIQVWPHHFDMSMIWLPGAKVPDQDPANEEYADMQMNFGFVFGDAGIEKPYLYVTAYPLPDAMPGVELPNGTIWQTEGFSGAVLLYRDLVSVSDSAAYLQELWSALLASGRAHMAISD